ncbi:MAG: TonB family protein [Actinomycetota bacterium]
MKFLSFPQIKLTRLRFFSFFLLTPLILSLTAFSQNGMAQQTPLSLVDIVAVLRSKKVPVAERNQLLTEGVKQRGITFTLNLDLEKELRTAGADDALVAAIREKSPVIKVSATTPKVEAIPVSTPRPPDAAFYQNRANANFVMGEYDTAITDYNKAIELNAKDPAIYFSRALAHFNNKSFNLAIADFDKVVELDPKEAMAFFKRGSALEKVGNFEKALGDYQKAVELDADNEPAKNALQRLQASLPKPVPTTPTKEFVQKTETTPQNKTTTAVKEVSNPNEPLNIGALNRFAAKLAMPIYPSIERQRNTEGLVTVEITLDEEGKVTLAKATSGPKGLRQPAEEAVRKSKFKPIIVENKAVKATGFINFNFKVT